MSTWSTTSGSWRQTPACEFDEQNLPGTVLRYEVLADSETCPHVRRAEPRSADLEFFVSVDAPCYKDRPETCGCGKPDKRRIHFLASFQPLKRRGSVGRRVKVKIRSFHPDAVRFPGGHCEGDFYTWEMSDPWYICPFYSKTASPDPIPRSLELDRMRKEGVRIIDVQIEFQIEKQTVDAQLLHQPLLLQTRVARLRVSIADAPESPPGPGVVVSTARLSSSADRPKANEADTHMQTDLSTEIVTKTILEALKLVVADGYQCLKNRFISKPEEKEELSKEAATSAAAPILTPDDVGTEALSPTIALKGMLLRSEVDKLKSLIHAYEEYAAQRNDCEVSRARVSVRDEGSRHQIESMLRDKERELTRVKEQISESLNRLLGEGAVLKP